MIPMKLADFMVSRSITPRQLRRMLGVRSRSTVLRYITGERMPSPKILDQIERLSGGLVRRADFKDPTPPESVDIVIDRRGRPQTIYPWSALEQDRPLPHFNDNDEVTDPPERSGQCTSDETPEKWPSRPLQRALDLLGPRARIAKRGGFLLDGRLVDSRRIVLEANRLLKSQGKPQIRYPGITPIR